MHQNRRTRPHDIQSGIKLVLLMMTTAAYKSAASRRAGLAPTRVRDTEHFRTLREFWRDPDGFVGEVLGEREGAV